MKPLNVQKPGDEEKARVNCVKRCETCKNIRITKQEREEDSAETGKRTEEKLGQNTKQDTRTITP